MIGAIVPVLSNDFMEIILKTGCGNGWKWGCDGDIWAL